MAVDIVALLTNGLANGPTDATYDPGVNIEVDVWTMGDDQ